MIYEHSFNHSFHITVPPSVGANELRDQTTEVLDTYLAKCSTIYRDSIKGKIYYLQCSIKELLVSLDCWSDDSIPDKPVNTQPDTLSYRTLPTVISVNTPLGSQPTIAITNNQLHITMDRLTYQAFGLQSNSMPVGSSHKKQRTARAKDRLNSDRYDIIIPLRTRPDQAFDPLLQRLLWALDQFDVNQIGFVLADENESFCPQLSQKQSLCREIFHQPLQTQNQVTTTLQNMDTMSVLANYVSIFPSVAPIAADCIDVQSKQKYTQHADSNAKPLKNLLQLDDEDMSEYVMTSTAYSQRKTPSPLSVSVPSIPRRCRNTVPVPITRSSHPHLQKDVSLDSTNDLPLVGFETGIEDFLAWNGAVCGRMYQQLLTYTSDLSLSKTKKSESKEYHFRSSTSNELTTKSQVLLRHSPFRSPIKVLDISVSDLPFKFGYPTSEIISLGKNTGDIFNSSVSTIASRGIFTSGDILRSIAPLSQLLSSKSHHQGLPWISITVTGFVDSPVCWADKKRASSLGISGSNGHSGYTIILFPQGRYIIAASTDQASEYM